MKNPIASLAVSLCALALGCAQGSVASDGVKTTAAPAQGQARTTYSALKTPRAGHVAVYLGGDLVFMAGGHGSGGDTAEVVDGSSATSLALPHRMTESRVGHGGALLPSGEVLLFGGENQSQQVLATFEVWSPKTQEFTPLPQRLARPRLHARSLVVDGKLLIVGGLSGDGPIKSGIEGSAEVWDLTSEPIALVGTVQVPVRDPQSNLVYLDGTRALHYGGHEAPVAIDVDTLSVEAIPQTDAQLAQTARVVGGTAVTSTLRGQQEVIVLGGRVHDRPSRNMRVAGAIPEAIETPRLAPIEYPTLVADRDRIYAAGGAVGAVATDRLTITTARKSVELRLSVPRRQTLGTLLPKGRVLFSGGYDPWFNPTAALDVVSYETLERTQAFAAAILTREDLNRRLDLLEQLTAERDAALAEVDRLLDELGIVQAEIDRLLAVNAGLQASLAALRGQLGALDRQRANAASEEQALRGEIARLEGAINDVNAAAQAARDAAARLQREADAAAALAAAASPPPAPNNTSAAGATIYINSVKNEASGYEIRWSATVVTHVTVQELLGGRWLNVAGFFETNTNPLRLTHGSVGARRSVRLSAKIGQTLVVSDVASFSKLASY